MRHVLLALIAFCSAWGSHAQTFSNRYDLQGFADVTVERYNGLPGGGGLIASIRQDNALVVTRVAPDGGVAWSTGCQLSISAQDWYGVYDMGQLADGGFYVLGSIIQSFNYAWALLRFDATGEVIWGRKLGFDLNRIGFEYDKTSKVVQRADGNLVVMIAGAQRFALVGLDLVDANLLFSKSYSAVDDSTYLKNPGFDMTTTDDGGVIVCGKDRDWPFLLRADAMGQTVWAKRYPGIPSTYTHWRNMARLSNGDLLIAGFSAESGGCIWRLNGNGTIQWMKSLIGTLYFREMADLGNGEFAVTDETNRVIRFNENGEVLNTLEFNSSEGTFFMNFLGGSGSDLELASTFVPNSGTQLLPIVLRMPESGMLACSANTYEVLATDVPGVSGYSGTSAVVQFDEACEVTDMPITSDHPAWVVSDVCQLLVGIDEGAVEAVRVSPTLLNAGTPITISGVEPSVDHMLIASDGRIARSGVGSSVNTIGLAPGLYSLRVNDGSSIVLVARVVFQ